MVAEQYDVVIIGGGPGGCAAAMFLLAEGIRPLIIEKDEFPRYHIGESMTGEAGGVIRALGLEERMKAAGHPEKHGVKVYGPSGHGKWFVPVMRRTETGELAPAITWQVRRAEFDAMMLEEAQSRGARLLRGEAVEVLWSADRSRMTGVRVRLADGALQEVRAAVTMDCSGQRTFFAHQKVTSSKVPGRYDKQVAVFSQLANPVRDAGGPDRSESPENTLIFYKSKYHWSWFIPLNDEMVSVGVVAPGAHLAASKESKAEYLSRELRELNPEMARRITDPALHEPARAIPNYSYHCRSFTGPGWMCVGDTHRFIDPIFSFGLYLTMKESQFAAPVIRDYLGSERTAIGNPFEEHQVRMETALDKLQALIDGFWENPLGFAYLVHGAGGRYRDDLIDLFAGRIYAATPSPGLLQLEKLAASGLSKAS
jgi:FADH2-dependent halogenase